jgi:peptidoglycan-associated lipoprotein
VYRFSSFYAPFSNGSCLYHMIQRDSKTIGKGEKEMKRSLALAGIIGLIVCFLVIPMTGCAKKTIVKEEAATAEQRAAAERKAAADREQEAVKAKAAKDAAEQKRLKDMASREEAASGAAAEAMAKDDKIIGDINFDYDKYSLRSEAREILKGHAAWLANNKDYQMVIEGHCDERGTTEYNLALGERRAAEAMKYLVGLGVDAKRLKTISYGKEMPLDPGKTEEAWAKNRRDHFVVTPKK